MAKEQLQNWLKTGLILAAIVFAGGGYAMKVQGNTSKIDKVDLRVDNVEDEVDLVKEDVHKQEVRQQRDMALKESLLGSVLRLEGKMDAIGKEQTQIKLDVNTTKVQVNTLIKE